MITVEEYGVRRDGVKLVRTFSDQNLKIRKVGTEEIYDTAIDVEGAGFTYKETEEPIGSADGEES